MAIPREALSIRMGFAEWREAGFGCLRLNGGGTLADFGPGGRIGGILLQQGPEPDLHGPRAGGRVDINATEAAHARWCVAATGCDTPLGRVDRPHGPAYTRWDIGRK